MILRGMSWDKQRIKHFIWSWWSKPCSHIAASPKNSNITAFLNSSRNRGWGAVGARSIFVPSHSWCRYCYHKGCESQGSISQKNSISSINCCSVVSADAMIISSCCQSPRTAHELINLLKPNANSSQEHQADFRLSLENKGALRCYAVMATCLRNKQMHAALLMWSCRNMPSYSSVREVQKIMSQRENVLETLMKMTFHHPKSIHTSARS